MQSVFFIGGGWKAAGGIIPVPIDDAYIHAQYAKNLARGMFFTWSEGDGYSKGETAPLYPILLAAGWLAGFRDHWIMAFAALLNVAAVWLGVCLLYDLLLTHVHPATAFCAALLWIVSGAMIGMTFSGMETGLACGASMGLVWAFHRRQKSDERLFPLAYLLCGMALLLLRPESLIMLLIFTGFILAGARKKIKGRDICLAVAPIIPLALFMLLNWLMTGDPLTNSMRLKSIWQDPLISWDVKLDRWAENVAKFPGVINTALFGRDAFWGMSLFVLCLGSASGCRTRLSRRGFFSALVAALVAAVIFYAGQNNFLGGENARYFQPWMPLLFILAALGADFWGGTRIVPADKGGLPGSVNSMRRARQFIVVNKSIFGAAALLLILALMIPSLIFYRADFIRNSRNLADYQIRLGRYVAQRNREQPGVCRRILTHDAGALLYFSGVSGFDVLGLCSEIKGYPLIRAQRIGTPMAFEALESYMPSDKIPDWAIIYKHLWSEPAYAAELIADPIALGASDSAKFMEHLCIFRFPKELLGTGHELIAPQIPDGWRVADRLDVADLKSEAEHEFYIRIKEENAASRVKFIHDPSAQPPLGDVGRAICATTNFSIGGLTPGRPCLILGRFASRARSSFEIKIGGRRDEIALEKMEPCWIIRLMEIPEAPDKKISVILTPRAAPYPTLAQVWALQPMDDAR